MKLLKVITYPKSSLFYEKLKLFLLQQGEAVNSVEDFLILLSVCHTVIPENSEDGSIHYNAASPDEKALVEAAAKYGYEFVARKPESVTIKTPDGSELVFEVLHVIEFTSTRKRMSVIVRTPNNKLKIYSKVLKYIFLK